MRPEETRDAVKAAFREAIQPAAAATVQVLVDGKEVALGAVVDADGYIVTKASLLEGDPICRLPDGREMEAQLVGTRDEHDLALLKVPAEQLTPVPWQTGGVPPVGSWLAAVAQQEDPLAIGIVSTEPRRIGGSRVPPKRRGELGVGLSPAEAGPRISRVFDETAAEEAGLEVGDVIISIDGKAVRDADHTVEMVGSHKPGESIELRLRRGQDELRISATLKEPRDSRRRHAPEDHWGGGPFSRRRYGFPLAFPHDAAVPPNRCGGPLVDTDGLVVGINIARALRVTNYAIPAEVVRKAVARMMEEN